MLFKNSVLFLTRKDFFLLIEEDLCYTEPQLEHLNPVGSEDTEHFAVLSQKFGPDTAISLL